VGENGNTDKGDWIRKRKELFNWIGLTQFRCNREDCGVKEKIAVQEKIAVESEGKK